MPWSVRKVSKIVILVITGAALLYDVLPFGTAADGDTISEVMLDYGARFSVIPFAWGVLMGHFWWPSNMLRARTQWRGWKLVPAIITLAFIVADTVLGICGVNVPPFTWLRMVLLVPFCGGVVFGHYYWTQPTPEAHSRG